MSGFTTGSKPVARRPHRCDFCEHPIQVGERHVMLSGFYDGAWGRWRYHDTCSRAISRELKDGDDWNGWGLDDKLELLDRAGLLAEALVYITPHWSDERSWRYLLEADNAPKWIHDQARDRLLDLKRMHQLKTWPTYYDDVESGRKAFELRRNDRDFMVGDILELWRWDPVQGSYTGRKCWRRVSYMLDQAPAGLEAGYVVLGLEPVE